MFCSLNVTIISWHIKRGCLKAWGQRQGEGQKTAKPSSRCGVENTVKRFPIHQKVISEADKLCRFFVPAGCQCLLFCKCPLLTHLILNLASNTFLTQRRIQNPGRKKNTLQEESLTICVCNKQRKKTWKIKDLKVTFTHNSLLPWCALDALFHFWDGFGIAFTKANCKRTINCKQQKNVHVTLFNHRPDRRVKKQIPHVFFRSLRNGASPGYFHAGPGSRSKSADRRSNSAR